jgi:hypothetical protein
MHTVGWGKGEGKQRTPKANFKRLVNKNNTNFISFKYQIGPPFPLSDLENLDPCLA